MNNLKNIINLLESNKNVFLTGGAGVGKTTTTLNIIKHFESEAKKVAKLASTGMAATLLGGQTLHSFFDLGIANNIQELELKKKKDIKKKIKKIISNISLIVIDEISMVSDTLFEMVYFRLQQANFQGTLLVVGDFLQLPPIQKNKSVSFAFESPVWKSAQFHTIELTHIYRTDNAAFIHLLQNIRFGFVDESIHNHLNQYIKPLPENLSEFTFLFGKNNSASQHNIQQLNFLDGELFIKEAQIIKHKNTVKDKEIEQFLNDARIEKELAIKIGTPVLFTRNAWNYFNGERGKIINIDQEYLYIQKKDGKIIKLEQIQQSKYIWNEQKINDQIELVEEAIFSIYQYPIKPAFAITIHKSQGMSIEDLIIQTNEIFSPSQFYVAISRSSNPYRLNLIAPQKQWSQLIYVHQKALKFVQC